MFLSSSACPGPSRFVPSATGNSPGGEKNIIESWDRKLLNQTHFLKIAVALLYIFKTVFIPARRGQAGVCTAHSVLLPLAHGSLRAETGVARRWQLLGLSHRVTLLFFKKQLLFIVSGSQHLNKRVSPGNPPAIGKYPDCQVQYMICVRHHTHHRCLSMS